MLIQRKHMDETYVTVAHARCFTCQNYLESDNWSVLLFIEYIKYILLFHNTALGTIEYFFTEQIKHNYIFGQIFSLMFILQSLLLCFCCTSLKL